MSPSHSEPQFTPVWAITTSYTEHDTGDPDCPNYRVGATVKGPEQREPIKVAPVAEHRCALDALRVLADWADWAFLKDGPAPHDVETVMDAIRAADVYASRLRLGEMEEVKGG